MPLTNTEPGSQPLEDPRREIYCVEMAAGMVEEDAKLVAGVDFYIAVGPGEKVSPKRTRVQTQTLRRVNARLAILAELERGLDEREDRHFLARNRRATAELRWFKLVLEHSGLEPEFDDDGRMIPLPKKTKPQTNGEVTP